MNVGDIATRVRRVFGDESSVQVTDQDIIRWVNDAQEQIILENEGLMEATATANITAGQADYDVPADMSVLRSLMYNGFRMKSFSFAQFNEYVDGFKSDSNPYGNSTPNVFMIWNNVITVFPTPNVTLANGLTIYYMKHPAAITSLADTPSIPSQYHNAIVIYCLKQAYEMDEDMYKAALKQNEFEQHTKLLNDRNKWISQEYYPTITTLPEDGNYGTPYGYGGYY